MNAFTSLLRYAHVCLHVAPQRPMVGLRVTGLWCDRMVTYYKIANIPRSDIFSVDTSSPNSLVTHPRHAAADVRYLLPSILIVIIRL